MDFIVLKGVLVGLPRPLKRALIAMSDLVSVVGALWLAFALHFNQVLPAQAVEFWWGFLLFPLLSVPLFYSFGLHDSVIRYQGSQVVYLVLKAVTASAVLVAALAWVGLNPPVSPALAVLYWLVAFPLLGGSRFVARSFLHADKDRNGKKKPVMIYGAGISGMQVALSLINGPEYKPVAFIDDNASLCNTLVRGIRVYSPASLESLVERYHVEIVLLAMPSVCRSTRKAIVTKLDTLPVKVKTLPGIAELVSGSAQVSEFREVQIEDLLGRDPVAPEQTLLSTCIAGKVVMVTGGGGSIGGELARQILRIGPRKLILYEVSENALYQIERQLQRLNGHVEIVPILGSVTNRSLLEHVMTTMQVQTVYHAAAYKHVPLVEHNLLAGIRNNVLGTWRTAEAAVKAQVETFILISTDKAVRPTNVMGASKRLGELVLQGIEQRQRAVGGVMPVVSMVRFGNVLGSSGSVVPLFRKQISDGGPVTVTHADVERYFMTLPEAANLVIQAGAMASGGEVFVLDMGDPVRVLDLAKRMIRLAGYEHRSEGNPNGTIDIKFTGLRPGEKLVEELWIGQATSGTRHSKIWRANESFYDWDELLPRLQQLEVACSEFDYGNAKAVLMETVPEYCPADTIVDALWSASPAQPEHPAPAVPMRVSSQLQ